MDQGAEFLPNSVLGQDTGQFLVAAMTGRHEFVELFQDEDQVQGCIVI